MFGGRSRTCSESSEGGAAGDAGSGSSGHQQRLGTSAPAGGFLTAGLLGQKAAQSTANNNNVGTAYDLEGKFTYSQVLKANMGDRLPTTVDENGKFSYVSADMRPVPPGWYDLDKSKHRVPIGWYDQKSK